MTSFDLYHCIFFSFLFKIISFDFKKQNNIIMSSSGKTVIYYDNDTVIHNDNDNYGIITVINCS